MKKLFLVFILFHSSLKIASAQQVNLDSLWGVWNDNTKPDTSRMKAMNKIAWFGYLFSQPDSAFYLAQLACELAERSGQKKHMAYALNTQGLSLQYRSNYPEALDYYNRSLKLHEEIGGKKGIATVTSNLGTLFQAQDDFLKALKYFQRSLKIKEENGNKNGIATDLNNIATIYLTIGEYHKGLENLKRCVSAYEDNGDKNGLANALSNIGIGYEGIGDYDKALSYLQKGLKLNEEIGSKRGVAMCIHNIGSLHEKEGDYPLARECFQRSFDIIEGLRNKYGMALNLSSIGGVYRKEGDYVNALIFCQRGLLLAEEINVLKIQKSSCQCLYDAYKAMGKGNDALVYLEKVNAINDRLNAEETTKKLQLMEFQKEMLADSIAKAEEARLIEEAHQEEVRQEQQTRNWSLAGGLVVLILAGGLYGRVRYIRKSKAIIEKAHERSENLLLNILPADIAQELKEKGKADARDFDMVSILFTDFKGFTEQSAKLSAADLVNEINHCFEAFDGIMEKYGIEKIKTIGDAYMAAGGLPVPSDDSVKNTVLAALEMQAFIAQRKAENGASNKAAFEMRVGIHTGPVVAGIVGVKKFQYDIWGDTVNTASRMESAGEVGKVNISQATYELLKDNPEFAFENRGKIEAKGKGEMEMLFVSFGNKKKDE